MNCAKRLLVSLIFVSYVFSGLAYSQSVICDAFTTPNKLNIKRNSEHSFKIHLYPCDPMEVSVGDTADVYVDLDDNGVFDEYENYLAIVSSTDSNGVATDIAVKVYEVPLTEEIDPFVAIYSVNNIAIADTAGNDIDYLQVTTFAPGNSGAGPEMPREFALNANYPNPFNASTTIYYQLPAASEVKLEVYNILGQKVATLVDGKQEGGYRSAIWEASGFGSGLYFYRLTAGEYTETKRMMLVK